MNAEFAESAEKKREESLWRWIVRAHPSQTARRMGHPQVIRLLPLLEIEEHRQECLCHTEERQELEGEDLEVALAGEDYGEEAAVGGEGVFADG
jgi:hypothetical protein